MVTENSIYVGKVRHRRSHVKNHEFNYKLFMFYFDISKMDEAFKKTRLCSLERFNWFSFRRKNHLGKTTTPLDESVRNYILEKTGKLHQGKIFLLTHLSTLGYCFNPISIYCVFKPNSDEIDMLLLEVTNTPWGEQHTYILDSPTTIKKGVYQYVFKKEMHVSPFMAMDYIYKFNFKIDNTQLIVHMDSYQGADHHFDATLSLKRMKLDNNDIGIMIRRFPLITYKVTCLIYWEAFKLFFKKVPFHSHPKSREL